MKRERQTVTVLSWIASNDLITRTIWYEDKERFHKEHGERGGMALPK